MTLKEALDRLEALGSDKVRAQNRRHGAGDDQFGVKLGDIRTVAKAIKASHALALALELWETGNFDARLRAILLHRQLARLGAKRTIPRSPIRPGGTITLSAAIAA